MLPLHKNPLIYRGWRTSFRFGNFMGATSVIFGLLFLAFLFLVFQQTRAMRDLGRVGDVDWPVIYRVFTGIVLSVQILLAFYVAMGRIFDVMSIERMRKTVEFLITLPIEAPDKVVGLCGSNLYALFLLLTMTPIGLGFGLAGGISLESLAWLYVMIAAGFVTCSLIGVAFGGLNIGGVGWLIVLLLLGIGIGVIGAVGEKSFTATPVLTISPYAMLAATFKLDLFPSEQIAPIFKPGGCHFFGLEVPWQLCPMSFLALLAIFAFIAAARKLGQPSQPAFRRLTVIIGLAALHLLLIGFLSDTFNIVRYRSDGGESLTAYLAVSYLLVLLYSLTSMPAYPQLMLWAEEGPGRLRRMLTQAMAVRSPNTVVIVIMWVLSTVAVLDVNNVYLLGISPMGLTFLAGVLLVFLVANHLVCLLACLTWPRTGHAMALLILLIMNVIPIIFSAIEGLEFLRNATFVGVFDGPVLHDLLTFGWDDAVLAHLARGTVEMLAIACLCGWRLAVMLQRAPGLNRAVVQGQR